MTSYSSRPAYSAYDLVIVGSGIVGLATAREFLLKQPGLKLLVLEKEKDIAAHQTGHNSGVIHTGIYYAPGSLKARSCVAGHTAMLEYCREKGIPFELSGKVIVALDESELPSLDELYRRGTVNGVQGLEVIGKDRLKELEPYAAGIKGIYSPNTGIIDYVKVSESYARDIVELGGEISTGNKVKNITTRGNMALLEFRNSTQHYDFEVEASYVITCGGLYSDKLTKMDNKESGMRIIPFRGDYFELKPEKRYMVNSMIYPVPDPRFPFLGVHFTRRPDGEVWAGPNAVLAFAREGYSRWKINPKELGEVLAFGGFWNMASKFWKMGMLEMYRDYYKAAFVKALQRYMPEITGADLVIGPSGVRAQAMDMGGNLVDDFLIKHGEKVIHVQNAPSPAATSSLIIAQNIYDEASRSFDFSSKKAVF